MTLTMVWRPTTALTAGALAAEADEDATVSLRGGGSAWLQALSNRTPRMMVGVRMGQGVL
ncbi:MAG: hypothetical protein L6R48_02345 [Planctomycetes bacterium]|nr:hypothetical protein [Planctomycetota bacterium]